jgi:hypothetical protein
MNLLLARFESLIKQPSLAVRISSPFNLQIFKLYVDVAF